VANAPRYCLQEVVLCASVILCARAGVSRLAQQRVMLRMLVLVASQGTHCNTLQQAAVRCNTLQHAATRVVLRILVLAAVIESGSDSVTRAMGRRSWMRIDAVLQHLFELERVCMMACPS